MLTSLTPNVPDVPLVTRPTEKLVELMLQVLEKYHILPSMLEEYHRILSSNSLFFPVIYLMLGLLGCFWGYKFCRYLMAGGGFFMGMLLGAVIITRFFNSNLIVFVGSFQMGLISAYIAYRIYEVGIFIYCFLLAFIASANAIPLNGSIVLIIAMAIGILVGSLALKSIRPVVILTSTISCAYLVKMALSALNIKQYVPLSILQNPLAGFACFLVLFVLGTSVQFLTTTDPPAKAKKKK